LRCSLTPIKDFSVLKTLLQLEELYADVEPDRGRDLLETLPKLKQINGIERDKFLKGEK